MKYTETVERRRCDVCGAEAHAWNACDECGKDLCRDHVKEYAHAVWFSGGGDAHYCAECETRLLAAPNPRFLAYRKIVELRAESKAWNDDFKRRCDAADTAIEKQAWTNTTPVENMQRRIVLEGA